MNRVQTQRSKIPLAKPILDDEMKEAALNALQNERFVLGESVHKFEEEFAGIVGRSLLFQQVPAPPHSLFP